MEFVQVGPFGGQPLSYQEIVDNTLGPAFETIFKPETKFVCINWHNPNSGLNASDMHEMVKPHVSERSADNANVVVVVNFGWTHSYPSREWKNIESYMNERRLCNTPAIPFKEEDARKNEFAPTSKDGTKLVVWYKSRYGYSILYFLWDAFHVSSESAVKEIRSEIEPIALRCYKPHLFLEKFAPTSTKEGDGKVEKYISIYDRAVEAIGGEENIPKIREKMMAEAPMKQVVLLLNQIIGGNNNPQKIKGSHTDLKEVEKWLQDWSLAKWPYYVMFGYKLKISTKLDFELDADRDKYAITDMVNSLRASFPKYALIIDQFDKKSIISNQILNVPSKLHDIVEVKKGEKLSKFLSSFLNDEKFDIELSKVIGKGRINSNLFISIDPMDYLTCSITKNDWHSCHEPINGCCGAGGASYMFDQGTLISYMSSGKEFLYEIRNNGKPFCWTSKSWRQMIYGDYKTNTFIFTREYPQDTHHGVAADAVRAFLEETVANFCDVPNSWIIKRNGSKGCQFHTMNRDQAAYDDVPSRQHNVVFMKGHRPDKKIVVGQVIKCVKTGEYIRDSKTQFFKYGTV